MAGAASYTGLRAVSKDEARDCVPSSFETRPAGAPQDEAKGSADHAHDVGLLHDQELVTIDLDFGAGPLAEQHAVAGLEVDRNEFAGFVAAAWADSDDLAFLRLLLGG